MKKFLHFASCSLSLLLFLANPIWAAEEAKPAAALAPGPGATNRTLSLEVTVLRFRPNSAARVLRGFRDLKGNLKDVVDELKTNGAISILYSGNREIFLDDKGKAKFDALETRPVVLVGKPGAPMPPAMSYGLSLEICGRAIETERVGLSWTGFMTWSPDIVDTWNGEKFLSFLGTAAAAAQQATTAMGITNKDVGIGLSFAQQFSPKNSPTDSQIYELPVNKTISFSSSRSCKSGELIVNATTAEMGTKEAQTILLLIWPTINP